MKECLIYFDIQIDNYNEDTLGKERQKLKDVDAFTILDYIKTSIEILMNMKMDENDPDKEGKKGKSKPKNANEASTSNLVSDSESMRSMDDPPKDYE